MFTFLLVTLLSLCSLSASSLIVSKTFKEKSIVKGSNLTVLISITNKGASLAKDLTLHDQTFNNGSAFKIVAGKNYQKVPDIPVNKTYSTRFVVMPKVGGWIKGYPAVVKFENEKGKFTSYSTFKDIFVANLGAKTAAMVCSLYRCICFCLGSTKYVTYLTLQYQLLSLGVFLVIVISLYSVVKSKAPKEKKKQ